MTSPISAYASRLSGRPAVLDPEEFWAISFDPGGHLPKNCSRMGGVSRRTLWQHVDMATLSLCRLAFPTLPIGRVSFTIDSASDLIPDQGWRPIGFDQTRVGLLASGRRATMTFRLPSQLRGGPVELAVRTAAPASAEITFGGVVLTARSTDEPTRLIVEIPRALVDRSITQPLTLAFRASTPASLDLKVLSLSLQPGKEPGSG
jgi:hypothetical protein